MTVFGSTELIHFYRKISGLYGIKLQFVTVEIPIQNNKCEIVIRTSPWEIKVSIELDPKG